MQGVSVYGKLRRSTDGEKWMPELRKDPIIKRWVLIAKERARRPSDFKHTSTQEEVEGGFCPFCEGNEKKTPPEILAYRKEGTKPDEPGWWLRVIPNKYPALDTEGSLCKRGVGMYDMMNGIGSHEVIVESPEHIRSQTEMETHQVREVMWAYKERLMALKENKINKFGLVFKNVGKEAGASLYHTHSQLIATPFVPVRIEEEIRGAREYFNYRGRCIFCDMIVQELEQDVRVVEDTEHFVAIEPFAARFPFETWVIPKTHSSHYEDIEATEVSDLALIMKRVQTRLETVLENPPYNYIIRTAPFDVPPLEEHHWHIEIVPRLTKVAGFEWGTGCYINPVAPEDACKFLKEVSIETAEGAKI